MLRIADRQPKRTDLTDAGLESALGSYSLAELHAVQDSLQKMHRDGHTVGQIVVAIQKDSADVAVWLSTPDHRHDADKVMMLLAALAVAIAWQTYRARPADPGGLLHAIERIESGVAYTLPIPRHKSCFCGSEDRYRDCHGRPPIMDMIA